MLNEFYTLKDFEHTSGSLSCTIQFNREHPIFSGHFPGNPIVPGVCTMQMIGELLEKALRLPVSLREASSIKYLQLITPESTPLVSISWMLTGRFYAISATLKDGAQTLFKMSGKYLCKQEGLPALSMITTTD